MSNNIVQDNCCDGKDVRNLKWEIERVDLFSSKIIGKVMEINSLFKSGNDGGNYKETSLTRVTEDLHHMLETIRINGNTCY